MTWKTTAIEPVTARTGSRHGALLWLARLLYLLGAATYTAAVVAQVCFAGLAVLVDPAYWPLHRAFGPLLGPLALGLVLLGLLARPGWPALLLTLLLLPLFVLQFIWLYAPLRLGMVELRALHAVNALLLFWIGQHLARRAAHLLRRPPGAQPA